MLFVTLVSEIFPSIPSITANILIVIDYRIARVLKASGATQAVVLDISKTFYRVWHTGLPYKLKLYSVMTGCFISLDHFVEVK